MEHQRRDDQDEQHLDVADEHIGHDLGEHDLDRPHRHGEQVLHGAALALAGDRQRGHEQRRHHQHDADEARHDVEHGQLLGIVASMNHELERRRRQAAPAGPAAGRGRARSQMAASAAVALPMAEGSVASASIRIEGVSPRSTARSKFGGNLDDEQHLALRQRAFGLGLRRQRLDVVIAGVAQRGDQRALVFRMFEPTAGRSAGAADWC